MCKCSQADLFTLAKTIACSSIVVDKYLWYFLEWRHVSYLNLVCLILWFYLLCHVELSHFEWNQSFPILSNPVYMYIYKYYILLRTILLPIALLLRGIIFVYLWSLLRTTDEVEHPCCLYYYGDLSDVWCSNVLIFQSMWLSPTREEHGAVSAF